LLAGFLIGRLSWGVMAGCGHCHLSFSERTGQVRGVQRGASNEDKGVLPFPHQGIATLLLVGFRLGMAEVGLDFENPSVVECEEGVDRSAGIFAGDKIRLDPDFIAGRYRVLRTDCDAVIPIA
jgi:hypothetical protein